MEELTQFVTDFLADMETANAISYCVDMIPTQMVLMMTAILVVGLVGAVLRLIFDAL